MSNLDDLIKENEELRRTIADMNAKINKAGWMISGDSLVRIPPKGEVTYDNYKNNDFLIEDLANNILIAKEMTGITSAHQTSDYSKVEFYKKQVAVGFLFKRIMKTADSLGQLQDQKHDECQCEDI